MLLLLNEYRAPQFYFKIQVYKTETTNRLSLTNSSPQDLFPKNDLELTHDSDLMILSYRVQKNLRSIGGTLEIKGLTVNLISQE